MTYQPDRVIIHVDMDAFFAAVEQRDNPALRKKPVVVGADPKGGQGRGVVSTCSYEARQFGIHSAMPIAIAYRKCPYAVFLPVNGAKYSRVSEEVFEVLAQFTPDVEPISIDEAFLDVTGSYHFYKTPYGTANKIKEAIQKKVNLTASVGIAPVKMIAKMASAHCKPDGVLEIKKDEVLNFLKPLPVEKLWGVGDKSKMILNQLGILTIGDLARWPLNVLYEKFGEHGQHLFDLSHGIDPRPIVTEAEAKSVSHEHTFETDTDNRQEIEETFLALSEKVSRRLRKAQLKGKTLSVKIRLKGFKTFTRAFTFKEGTNFTNTIYHKAQELFVGFYKPGMKIRLLGVRLSQFAEPYIKESLFEDALEIKKEGVHQAIDEIKDKFGESAIRWGG